MLLYITLAIFPELERGLRSGTHLMVIKPTPAKMPMIANSCQNSRFRIMAQPRISTWWDRPKSTFCTYTSPATDETEDALETSEEVSSASSVSAAMEGAAVVRADDSPLVIGPLVTS